MLQCKMGGETNAGCLPYPSGKVPPPSRVRCGSGGVLDGIEPLDQRFLAVSIVSQTKQGVQLGPFTKLLCFSSRENRGGAEKVVYCISPFSRIYPTSKSMFHY